MHSFRRSTHQEEEVEGQGEEDARVVPRFVVGQRLLGEQLLQRFLEGQL